MTAREQLRAGLSDEEIIAIRKRVSGQGVDIRPWGDSLAFARAIEQAAYAAGLERAAEICARMEFECCGKLVVGAEYMGAQEMICCGDPEMSDKTPADCAAAIRAAKP